MTRLRRLDGYFRSSCCAPLTIALGESTKGLVSGLGLRFRVQVLRALSLRFKGV